MQILSHFVYSTAFKINQWAILTLTSSERSYSECIFCLNFLHPSNIWLRVYNPTLHLSLPWVPSFSPNPVHYTAMCILIFWKKTTVVVLLWYLQLLWLIYNFNNWPIALIIKSVHFYCEKIAEKCEKLEIKWKNWNWN